MKFFPKIKISMPTIIFVGLLIVLDRSFLSLLALSAALIHELGHLTVMLLLGVKVSEVEITFFGAEIRTKKPTYSVLGNIAIFGAGAAANILSAVIIYSLPSPPFKAVFFAGASLSLAVINLLPIRTLDGGCIIEAIILSVLPQYAPIILDIISSLTLGLLWLTAIYLLLINSGNLSLMLFCMYLFVTLAFGSQ